MDIRDLHRQGHSIRTITELTGLARNTVRRVLREQVPSAAKTRQRSSQLDPFKPYLTERHSEYALSAVRLLAEIRGMGYAGSVDVVRRFIHSLDPHKSSRQKMTVRFETPPGEQAQADWASCSHAMDETGRRRAVYAFVMVPPPQGASSQLSSNFRFAREAQSNQAAVAFKQLSASLMFKVADTMV